MWGNTGHENRDVYMYVSFVQCTKQKKMKKTKK